MTQRILAERADDSLSEPLTPRSAAYALWLFCPVLPPRSNLDSRPMTLDPIDPGAMPLATVSLTTNQARKLAEVVDEHLSEHQLDSVRLEQLKDAHVRVVLIGPDGDPVAERLLLPV